MQVNAARTARRRENVRQFIGIDGEGVTRESGDHEYVLLSVGNESYHRSDAPLGTGEIFDFLWDQYLAAPEAVFVGFYLAYDFTMWLKGLPEDRARMLLTDAGVAKRVRKKGRNPVPFPVYWQDWEMDMLGFKRFKLRRKGHPSWMYINDVGPFFQTSFLTAIDPKNWLEPICTDDEYEIIREGKTRRDVAVFDRDMIRYNVLENEVLSRVMSLMNDGLSQVGVMLSRAKWFGPGQAAQAWLNLIKAPDADVAKYSVPEGVNIAARASYYGGWFEITCHGKIPGRTFEYDINSAYPYATSRLPCLEHGRWMHDTGGFRGSGDSLTLVYATIHGSHSVLGTMPCRTKKGAILRPYNVRGWYWLHEIEAARAAKCIDHLKIHESYTFVAGCDHVPFSEIAKLYKMRLEIGKNTPTGKALKIIINSVYGKLAQSIGNPRYANPVYASLITSDCRTCIWRAIGTHPRKADAVTMVATDGVFFNSPHPYLEQSDRLGDWDCETHENLTQFMPGLYWDDRARQSKDGKVKSRGVAASDMKEVIDRIDLKWESTRLVVEHNPDQKALRKLFGKDWADEFANGWPIVGIPIRFSLVSAKLALLRNSWDTAGTIRWDKDDEGKRCLPKRFLSGRPDDKRNADGRYVDSKSVLRTVPYAMGPDGLDTVPYSESFGLDLEERVDAANWVTESGTVSDEIFEAVHRGM